MRHHEFRNLAGIFAHQRKYQLCLLARSIQTFERLEMRVRWNGPSNRVFQSRSTQSNDLIEQAACDARP